MNQQPFDLKCESGGLTFLVDKIGRQAGPLQKLRELVMNSIEAGATRIDIGPDPDIQVGCDERGEPGMGPKLSFVDDGHGMTAEELEHHTLSIALSGKPQGDDLNYGIGGRVSTLVYSTYGVEYTAWKNGDGNRIRLTKKKDRQGEARYCAEDFSGQRVVPVTDRPPFESEGKDSGFRVTLLGNSVSENTVLPPDGQRNTTYWIHRYLNQRFFQFKEGLTIRAGVQKDYRGKVKFEQVRGLRETILPFCESCGIVDLELENGDHVNVKAHWFLLKAPETENVQKGWVNRWGGGGQFGVLHKGELYHMRDRGEGNADLKRCGIILGCKRVIILIEPEEAAITVDLDRSRLRYKNSSELDLAEMQVTFARNMPKELREYQDSLYQPTNREDEQRQMRKFLEEAFQHMPPSWKVDPGREGTEQYDPDSEAGAARPRGGGSGDGSTRSSSTSTGDKSGDAATGKRARNVDPNRSNSGDKQPSDHMPNWDWIAPDSEEDALWGCAAQYQRGQRFVQFNPKYIGYERLVASITKEYAGQAEHHRKEIEAAVRFFYMMPIIQAVIGVEMELSARNWDIDRALSALEPQALTASSYAVGGLLQLIRRRLSAALGQKRAEEVH